MGVSRRKMQPSVLVTQEIDRFLATADPEVGATFTEEEALQRRVRQPADRQRALLFSSPQRR
jgi:hypothetical protein